MRFGGCGVVTDATELTERPQTFFGALLGYFCGTSVGSRSSTSTQRNGFSSSLLHQSWRIRHQLTHERTEGVFCDFPIHHGLHVLERQSARIFRLRGELIVEKSIPRHQFLLLFTHKPNSSHGGRIGFKMCLPLPLLRLLEQSSRRPAAFETALASTTVHLIQRWKWLCVGAAEVGGGTQQHILSAFEQKLSYPRKCKKALMKVVNLVEDHPLLTKQAAQAARLSAEPLSPACSKPAGFYTSRLRLQLTLCTCSCSRLHFVQFSKT